MQKKEAQKTSDLSVVLSSSGELSASPPTATRKLHLAPVPLMNRLWVALSVPPFARWAISESDSSAAGVNKGKLDSTVSRVN